MAERKTIYLDDAIDEIARWIGYLDEDMIYRIQTGLKKLPSAQQIIHCKDCKHRPTATEAEKGIYWGFSVEFPDEVCPLQCEDGWYNSYSGDEFYCGNAERREE